MRLFQFVLTIKNCFDRTVRSCQHFQTWRFGKEVCEMANMKNQFWSTIFENSVPPFKCPFHAVSKGFPAIRVCLFLLSRLLFSGKIQDTERQRRYELVEKSSHAA